MRNGLCTAPSGIRANVQTIDVRTELAFQKLRVCFESLQPNGSRASGVREANIGSENISCSCTIFNASPTANLVSRIGSSKANFFSREAALLLREVSWTQRYRNGLYVTNDILLGRSATFRYESDDGAAPADAIHTALHSVRDHFVFERKVPVHPVVVPAGFRPGPVAAGLASVDGLFSAAVAPGRSLTLHIDTVFALQLPLL